MIINQILWGVSDHGMPAFADLLTDREIAAAATFVRNSWTNNYGIVFPGRSNCADPDSIDRAATRVARASGRVLTLAALRPYAEFTGGNSLPIGRDPWEARQ